MLLQVAKCLLHCSEYLDILLQEALSPLEDCSILEVKSAYKVFCDFLMKVTIEVPSTIIIVKHSSSSSTYGCIMFILSIIEISHSLSWQTGNFASDSLIPWLVFYLLFLSHLWFLLLPSETPSNEFFFLRIKEKICLFSLFIFIKITEHFCLFTFSYFESAGVSFFL